MTLKETLLIRIEYVLEKGQLTLDSEEYDEEGSNYVDFIKLKSFRSTGLSFLQSILNAEHPYYQEFDRMTQGQKPYHTETAIEIIKNVKYEVANGWFTSIAGLISAEIFSDFLDMANHLLNNGYKDAAAVMIGSVLEEHMRRLCIKHNIAITSVSPKDGKDVPLKADRLNTELQKAGVYNLLVQKNITAQLDLRNNAAHGKYQEYDLNQVKLMHDFVLDFISKYEL